MRRGNVVQFTDLAQPLNEAASLVEMKQAEDLLNKLRQQVFNVGAEVEARNQEVRDASAALTGMENAVRLLALEVKNQELLAQIAVKNTAKVALQVGMFAPQNRATTETEENFSSSNSTAPAT